MASPVQLYQLEMHRNIGFFPTWLPSDPIELGDIGTLEGGRFRITSSLKELGIHCHPVLGNSAIDVNYTSTQGTKVVTSAGATASSLAKAEISIEFSREGAFLFHASGLRAQRLTNRLALGQALLEAHGRGQWNKDWLLVESLYVARRATILISQDRSSEIRLIAKAVGLLPATLLSDPRIRVSVTSTRGRIVQIVGAESLRPLYSCVRIRHSLLGGAAMESVRGTTFGVEDDIFDQCDIGTLLDS